MTDHGSSHDEDRAVRAAIDLDTLRCSFCGKLRREVADIVCGPTPSVAICNECVGLCREIMAEHRSGRSGSG